VSYAVRSTDSCVVHFKGEDMIKLINGDCWEEMDKLIEQGVISLMYSFAQKMLSEQNKKAIQGKEVL
jgi:hypothetical protein